MRKARKYYSPQEKMAILRRHLLDKVSVSRLCTEFQLQPTVFYRWLKQLFDNGAAALQRKLLASGPVLVNAAYSSPRNNWWLGNPEKPSSNG